MKDRKSIQRIELEIQKETKFIKCRKHGYRKEIFENLLICLQSTEMKEVSIYSLSQILEKQ